MNYVLSALNMSTSEAGPRPDEPPQAPPQEPPTESPPAACKLRVMLRIRPASPPAAEGDAPADLYAVEPPASLLVRPPGASDSARRTRPGGGDAAAPKTFSFDRIFDSHADQAQLFGGAVRGLLLDFLSGGRSSSVVSYGTADAGKTYTLFGPSGEPGLVPRSIGFVFSSTDEAEGRLEAHCSLWISFLEIYNERVYDLLEAGEEGGRAPLKLSSDKQGRTYAQGLRSLRAASAPEAYEILRAGQARLSTASAPGYRSSRSHSVFTMRLLKHEQACSPSSAQTSAISFYDLAAAGRPAACASGDKQLKESRGINTSLLALGRCLKALAGGRCRRSSAPFRDSKLTRLFQHSLRQESLILLVNLNPSSELFAETQNVLNFASTAMKLTCSEFGSEDQRSSDCRAAPDSPGLARGAVAAAIVPRTLREQDVHEIAARNERLLDQIERMKADELAREYKLRRDLAGFYTRQLDDLEDTWKSRMSAADEEKEYLLRFSADRVQTYRRAPLDEQLDRKRPGMDEGSAEVGSHRATLSSLERLLKSAKEENEQLSVQNKQYALEIAWLQDNLTRIADLIGSAEKYDDDDDSIVDDFSSKNLECLNNDTISHIRSIAVFVRESHAKEEAAGRLHCHRDFTLLERQSKKIEALLRGSDVGLPEIGDSSDLSGEGVDRTAERSANDLIERLSAIERSVVECLSQRSALRAQIEEKEEELRRSRSTNEQKDIDLWRMSQQHAESESARLLLLSKCESLEAAFKSREFFKNPDFDADESENSLSCACQREMICLKESLVDSRSVEAESKPARSSSDGSSRDDSGVALTLDSVASASREEKDCQTDDQRAEDQREILKDKLVQLNVDYRRMEARHSQGARRIAQLSSELERIGEAMRQLKEETSAKDRTIGECRSKLRDSEAQIDGLKAEKRQSADVIDALRGNLLAVSKDYERKLEDSQVQLRARQEGEYRASRCSKDYWEKCVYLGCQLSMAYAQLQKFSSRCYSEHVLRIRKLEEELGQKEASLADLNEQTSAYEKDLAEVLVLSAKVDECEAALSQLRRQKSDVERMVADGSGSQLAIRSQLDSLTRKIGQRDDQIVSLKRQLETVIKVNLSNSRKAKELGRQVTRLLEKMCTMKEDMAESETARTDLERKSAKEIDNLRARLTIFEGNADLLNVIRNSDESKQCEMDKLKLKVLEKEKELEFFKKNRNATIRRYECLVEQLQKSLKMNRHSSRTKKMWALKHSYCSNDSKGTACCYVRDSDTQHWQQDELEVRDQTKSVVHLSRRETEAVGVNGGFESFIEESCCNLTDFSAREVDGQN